MAGRGFSQEQVDGMELWIIAEVLDLHNADGAPGQTGGRPVTFAEHKRSAARLAAERVRRAEQGGPAPTAPAGGPVATAEQVEALRRRRAQRQQRKG